jgi:MYXO-CTERM domain-containing protein
MRRTFEEPGDDVSPDDWRYSAMGSVRIPLYAAGAAAALMALSGPAAAAFPGQGEVTLTPSAVSPGGDVDIRTLSCGQAVSGTVTSRAFVSTVRLAPAADGGLFAEAVVSSSTTPGSYPVSISCEGLTRATQATLTVTNSDTQSGDNGDHEKQWGGNTRGGGGSQEKQWGNTGGGGGQEKQWDNTGGGVGGGGVGGGVGGGAGGVGGGAGGGVGGGVGQEKQWAGGGNQQNQFGGGGRDSQWGDLPGAPVPAGGGGAAKLLASQGQHSHDAGVPGVVAAGVLAAAGIAGLAMHRRRRGRGQD